MSNIGLKQRFVRASMWMLAGQGVSQVLRFGSNLLMTRLLAPDLYGVMAVAYVVIQGLHMFSDVGLNAGAVRSTRGDDPTFLNVGWVVQIARGALVTVACLIAAGLLHLAANAHWLPSQSVYADPRVPPLLALVSISGLIYGFESTKMWTARRHLAMALVTKIEIYSQVATTAFMLTWALISPSLWALAGGYLFGALTRTVLSHVLLPGARNRFEWESSAFRETFHFGKWVFLSSSFTFFLTNGDRLMLGGMLDSKLMGFYSLALLLTSALQAALGSVVGYAALSALSEVFRTRPSELQQTMYRIRGLLDLACLLAAGALVMMGGSIVRLLYDSRYEPAGWMLSVLALTLVSTRLDIFDQCLIAIGRVKLLSKLNALRLISLYCLVPAGYFFYGVNGAVIAVAISSLINGAVVLTMQYRIGMFDRRRELLAFPIFGGGLLIGWAGSLLLGLLK